MEEHACLECGKPMTRRTGKKGVFWSCTGYPGCTFALDDLDGAPMMEKCPECEKFLRVGVNTRGTYTACYNKEHHADGETRFFSPEGKARQALQPNGDFACPECGAVLKYFVQKKGKNAGKPCFACFESELHEDGKPRFFRDNKGAPAL